MVNISGILIRFKVTESKLRVLVVLEEIPKSHSAESLWKLSPSG